MAIKLALVGNPNSGKTTLFNGLTGSNQHVGNWPGVTVDKKEGKIKTQNDNEAILVDLPGIYSLSPYTLEEVISRNYLVDERPDAIINIIDGSNLERNLYLTTQLLELGIPVIVAVNMMDTVRKSGDILNTGKLAEVLGCQVIEISALKKEGLNDLVVNAIELAKSKVPSIPRHKFNGSVEHAIAHIEEAVLHDLPKEKQRWYAIKLFERDEKIISKLNIKEDTLSHIEQDVKDCEKELNDDAESIITNERYIFIASIIGGCFTRKNINKLSTTDKIDNIVTNRIFALPIFAIVMFVVYFASITTVGTWMTDWTNEEFFGDGWFLGRGKTQYEEVMEEYEIAQTKIEAFEEAMENAGVEEDEAESIVAIAELYDEEGVLEEEVEVNLEEYQELSQIEEPDPSEYGTWVPGVPVIVEGLLEKIGVGEALSGLILDGIVGGVGAVLGFVPQMLVLFLFLAFLEDCGYMARIAFIMDRIFRKFGLSGKSFIPMLIGTGCSVPGIMASRTIENDRDRKMTIITTSFMPCGAKLPIIALIAGALFGGEWWVGPSAYFVGIAAIIVSGIILKKTTRFAGDPAPFVMELPAYHMPALKNVLKSSWERGFSFIKRAGTIILLATIFVWFTSSFGFGDEGFGMVDMDESILAKIGNAIAWIFAPLGWGNWRAAVAAITGLIAKENVVATFGVLFGGYEEVAENGWQIWENIRNTFTPLAAYSLLLFNLLCAPCFAAIGAIRREMNNWKWTAFAVAYQCAFAYIVALCVYQIGSLFSGGGFTFWTIVAFAGVIFGLYMLFRPESKKK